MCEPAADRRQREHRFLYWEHREQLAVRVGNFEAVKPDRNKPFESYDLSKDIGEKKDIASEYPNTLAKMKAYAGQSHTENLIRDVLYKEKIFKGHELR